LQKHKIYGKNYRVDKECRYREQIQHCEKSGFPVVDQVLVHSAVLLQNTDFRDVQQKHQQSCGKCSLNAFKKNNSNKNSQYNELQVIKNSVPSGHKF